MRSNSDGGQDDPMALGGADARSPEGAAKRGLWRLMLKLPAIRGQLQLLDGRSEALSSLCEAYEDVCATLERLLHAPGEERNPMLEEYQTLSTEVENEVIQYCLEKNRRVSD